MDFIIFIFSVVAVGGDGMFSEVLNGILASRPPPTDDDVSGPSIKIGLIPAGNQRFYAHLQDRTNDFQAPGSLVLWAPPMCKWIRS